MLFEQKKYFFLAFRRILISRALLNCNVKELITHIGSDAGPIIQNSKENITSTILDTIDNDKNVSTDGPIEDSDDYSCDEGIDYSLFD